MHSSRAQKHLGHVKCILSLHPDASSKEIFSICWMHCVLLWGVIWWYQRQLKLPTAFSGREWKIVANNKGRIGRRPFCQFFDVRRSVNVTCARVLKKKHENVYSQNVVLQREKEHQYAKKKFNVLLCWQNSQSCFMFLRWFASLFWEGGGGSFFGSEWYFQC